MHAQNCQAVRIIPADAGSTVFLCFVRLRSEDHPRRCGEHKSTPKCYTRSDGSSPRMRGALPPGTVQVLGQGIIPADAGSTFVLELRQRLAPDHPRGCGEHYSSILKDEFLPGSSPRMRGAQ